MAQCGGNPSRHAATKPTEKDLKVVANRAGKDWSSLLISLDIPWATIQSINHECPNNLWDACMNGLVIWLKGGVSDSNEPVTFGTLFAALKDSGMTDCVSLLVDRLDKRSTPHPRPTHEDKDEELSTPPSKRGKMEQKLVRAVLATEGLGAELEAARRRAQEQGECSSELAAVRIQLEQTRKEGVDVVDVLMTEKRSLQSEVQSCQERIDRLTAEGMAGAEDTAALQRRLKESEEMLQELEKDTVTQLQEKDTQLQEKDTQLQEKDTLLQEKDTLIAKLLEKIQRLKQNMPSRNWKELKCQKTLECGGYCCWSIAVQGDVVCVGVEGRVLLFSKTSGAQVSELGLDQIKGDVYGLAFIGEDTIVVSYDKRLRTYTTKGQLVRTFDSGRGGFVFRLLALGKNGFDPRGLTVGPDGCVFVCDVGNHCVCVFSVDGKLLSSFGSLGSGVGQFNFPYDVCMDGEGLLFISDYVNRRICVHSVEGAFIREFPTPRKPWCVAATHCNHLVVSSFSSDTAMIMTTSGQLVHEFGGEGSGPGQFIGTLGVAVDNEDCVYVCDRGNKHVHVY